MNSFTTFFLISILLFSLTPIWSAQWEVGTGQTYITIQEAIDNANTMDDDIINVHSGTYFEDIIVNKKLTIQASTGDDVMLNPTNTGFKVVNNVNGNGSGTIIDGFKIINSITGIGVNISADNCIVKNNQINGGKTGIEVSNGNHTLLDNLINGQSETGILGNLTGGFFIISGNTISNILGGDLANGITVTINGTLTDFNAIGNTISNISGNNADGVVFGIQLGKSKGADGNPEMANITNLIVTQNIITDIKATSAIIGMELITNSINTVISENKLSNLFAGIGSSVYGLEAAIMGSGDVHVSGNTISHISAGNQAVGIVTVAIGDLKLTENEVSSISNAQASVGILALGLLNNATLKDNHVFDINSPSIAAGMVGTALNNLKILNNKVMGVNGANDVAMVAAGFNSTKITGNNLEGDGNGNGVVICSSNGTINYNRIVNFQYYIQNFKFDSFGPNIDEMLKPIDDAIKKHPELEPILKPIRDDLDKLFHELENSNTKAAYNWYGTNRPDPSKFFKGNGTLKYNPWLVLTINPYPPIIRTGETSTITAHVYQDSADGDHRADTTQFFSGPQVTFTTDLGNLGSKSVTVPWVNGLATAILRADEAPGIATVKATDYQTVQTMVYILGAPVPPEPVINAQAIEMQNTGIPLAGTVLAIFMMFVGLMGTRKN